MSKKTNGYIQVKGACTHNLKNIDVSIPHNALTVITGLSGSGKSSLAFDTIFAEGQRRYIESLSSYARQFLHQLEKPDVEEITGLSPAISIDQKTRSHNPRSTVATVTEIYDYLRVLFARVGHVHCTVCGKKIEKSSPVEIAERVIKHIKEKKYLAKTQKKIKGVAYTTAGITIFSPVVRGRKGEYYQLLYDLLSLGYTKVRVDGKIYSLREEIVLTKNKKHTIDVIVDTISIDEFIGARKKEAFERLRESIERATDESDGLVGIMFPDKEELLISTRFMCPRDGTSFLEVEPRLFSFNSPYGACKECNGLGTQDLYTNETCSVCKGSRLIKEAQSVLLPLNNKKNISIIDTIQLPIEDAYETLGSLKLNKQEKEIAEPLLSEILSRLGFLVDVGLEYLTLERRVPTLSGGEAQRIRLASQIGSGLVGALYVLDEPTIGLHQRDNKRLIKTLHHLRSLGNTIIVVEHDEETIFASDYLIDIGPRAGVHGGEVVAEGYISDILKSKKFPRSPTLPYLQNKMSVPTPTRRRQLQDKKVIITGASEHNISNLNVSIPLEAFVCITGISGSGKSTLLYDILHKNIALSFDKGYNRQSPIINAKKIEGLDYIQRAIVLDQSPIGRTPRSTPATYVGAFTHIRELFAATSVARERGWGAGRFSFNTKTGGRCPHCEGNGEISIAMHFLPTVYVGCDVCRGKRYTKDTLAVKYKGKNIHDILRMSVEEACEFFKDVPSIFEKLFMLKEVGLGYILLGQSATTLSGGEAQRVKIASELQRRYAPGTIYLLDEPTIGLHYDDIIHLIDILHRLVHKGNSVIVIEHNMDIIKNADYIIDMGPEGGVRGGQVVAQGTPEHVAQQKKSYTGHYLKKSLSRKK